jgi:thiol-disulfide isomerase/thioredoxin
MRNSNLKIVIYSLLLIGIIALFFMKNKLTCFVTNYMLKHNDAIVVPNDSIRFFSQFDYTDKESTYKLTVVEFSGIGCKPCLKMDTVLNNLQQIYGNKVKVTTYKFVNDSIKVIAKYFGVNMIPTQIVLDKKGQEVFRHTGFLSEKELSKIIDLYLEK